MTTPAFRDERAAVDKAVSLLASFDDEQPSLGLGVSELARRAGMSKSTAFRLLGLLERNGIVERAGRNYRLGVRLHELGSRVHVPDYDRIRDALIPFLAQLYELTHETVHLGVLHGTDVVCLSKLYGHRRTATAARIGGRMPAHCSAAGRVLLAYDPDALDRVLRTELRRVTPHTITDPDRLAAEITAVRSEGAAFDDEEAALGVSCVAVPVIGHGGRAVAAMAVSVATGDFDTRALAHLLRQVSAAAARHVRRVRHHRPAPPGHAIA